MARSTPEVDFKEYQKCKEKFEEHCVREALSKDWRPIEKELKRTLGRTVKLDFVKKEYFVGRPKISFIDLVFKDSKSPSTYYLCEIKYRTDPLSASKIGKYAVRFSKKKPTAKIHKVIIVDEESLESEEQVARIEKHLDCTLVSYRSDFVMDILSGRKRKLQRRKLPKKTIVPEKIIDQVAKIIEDSCIEILRQERRYYIEENLWNWIDLGVEDEDLLFFFAIFDGIFHGSTGNRLAKYMSRWSFKHLLKFKDQVDQFIFEKGIKLRSGAYRYKSKYQKAIPKFIEFFSQERPSELIKRIFRKNYSKTQDSVEARRGVYNSLISVLKHCGFSGEHEVRYPIDVLYETMLFHGYIEPSEKQAKSTRIDKALRHIGPKLTWNQEKIDYLHQKVAEKLGIDTRKVNYGLWLYYEKIGRST